MVELLLIKIIVSIGVVIGLSLLAERVSTRFAGVLLGYPIATGIIMFFIGIEQGTEFAAQTSIWAISGLAAEIIFFIFYYFGVKYLKKFAIIGAMLLATAGFFISALILRNLPLTSRFISSILVMVVIIIAVLIFKSIKVKQISNPIKFSHKVLFIRAMFATGMILFITSFAKILGPIWSGILTSFPINAPVVLILIQYHYTREDVMTLIRGKPIGTVSLLIFLLSVSYFFPLYGVYLGILFSYILATVYLLIYEFFIKNKFKI
jgi:hypothetical protein